MDKAVDIKKEPLERSIRVREVNEDDRTVEIAFSSEEAYERWFGVEVLDHDANSVRLDRLNGGAAVLVNHDSRDQVGVVESARVDNDKRGRAVIRFSRSARGEEIFQDVQDGIRTLVSVGYRIHKYEVAEREGEADLIRVTDWEPMEVSIVAIPADSTVGVGRSHESESQSQPAPTKREETRMDPKEKENQRESDTPVITEEERNKERQRVRTEEKQRCDAIRQMADRFDVAGMDELARQAIDEDWTAAKFNEKALEKIGEQNSKARSESKHNGEVDLEEKDRKRFSIVRLMDAIAHPNDRTAQNRAAFELEVSAEAVRGFGSDFNCRGEFLPQSLLDEQAIDARAAKLAMQKRDLSVGTATAGGNLVATNLLAGSFIEVLRNVMVTARAGITILPGLVGNVDIPRQTAGAASTWISAEDGDASEDEPAFDQVPLTPKDLACYTEVTRRLLQQSTPAIEGLVNMDLAIAQAFGIDSGVLYGSGSSGQPTGVANQTGINTFNFAAADPTYAEIVRMIKEVMADNALMGALSFIIDPNGWEALSTTPKQGSGVEGNFILGDNDRIKGYPYQVTNQVTAEDYFFGNWSDVILGEWGGLEINVDPYTHSLKGKIRYITFKTCDVAVRHPESFIHCNDGV